MNLAYLQGKIFSYKLNAVQDQNIATCIFTGRYTSDEVNIRSREFEALSKKCTARNSFLLGVSFTQYCINGCADALYADFFDVLSAHRTKMLKEYEKITYPRRPHIIEDVSVKKAWQYYKAYRDLMSSNMMADMILFLEKELNTEYKPRPVGKGIVLPNKETFVLGIIATQYLNRHHNMKIAKTMTEGRTVKSKALLTMAREYKDADSFIRGAISTQVAAGRYDVLYKKYLMMRHRKIMKRPEVKAFVRELEGPSPVGLK